jgi:hypothetical protein
VQHVRLPACIDPIRIHARLCERSVRTVLTRLERNRTTITFVLTARHTDDEIDQAVEALAIATHGGDRTTHASWGGGSGNGR